MKVSLNTIKQYIDIDLSVDELVEKINQQLGQVEEVIDLGAKYKDVIVVKIVECDSHPNADKLSVCKVDDGGVVTDVARDERGLVQVVCGAPNARAGMFAAWLPPRSTVPASFSDKEPFVLDARELRGVLSQGMLAAPDELAIGTGHDGILEITEHDIPKSKIQNLKSGEKFAELFDLNDTIIDIENKMFTHRPDCFGQIGVAREIAGIQNMPFTSPSWYKVSMEFPRADSLDLIVTNRAGDRVPRFMAVAIKDVVIGQSPLWLQCELIRLGGKPINNIVDITNYVMLLTAQPLHAYDYDKLAGKKLGTRLALDGEKIPLLNGKEYSLTAEDIVIVDGEKAIGLGGVMGGSNSEVSSETKNVVLECATFDMYTIRKTSMRHGLFTDAVTRYNKGQSPLQGPACIGLAMQLINAIANGEQASQVFDLTQPDENGLNAQVEITSRFINERLGLMLDDKSVSSILQNVEFKVDEGPDSESQALVIQAPFWRTDIEMREDIVEEVGRLYGFDKLPRELPTKSIKPAPKNTAIETKRKVRQELSRVGANEVLTYSFVHENIIKRAGQDANQAYKLSNALSPELQLYRLSVLPSLLDKVHMNIKAGHDEFALFEFGKAHRKGDLDDESLPAEHNRLAFVYAAKKSAKVPYFIAKRYVQSIAPLVRFVPLEGNEFTSDSAVRQMIAPFEPARSATIVDGDRMIGIIGEFKQSVRTGFKLPDCSAGFEIDQEYLRSLTPAAYRPLSRFPSVTQDISLRVDNEVSYGKIHDVIVSAIDALHAPNMTIEINPVNIYSPDGQTNKTYTFRIRAVNHERTLTEGSVSEILSKVALAAKEACDAERV